MCFSGHESEVNLGGDIGATFSTSNTVSEVVFPNISFLIIIVWFVFRN